MKKIACLLILLFCVQSAFAETIPADGLYTIGVSSDAKMFVITDCKLRVEDGRMTAVLTMSGSGYGYLYQGTSEEADAAPMESWTPYFLNSEGKHCFAIEIPNLDCDMPMASWSIRYEKWYDRSAHFFSNTLTPYCEIALDGVYSAYISSDTKLNGTPCLLYSANGEMHLELPADKDLNLQIDGQKGNYADGVETISLSSLDKRFPIAFDSGNGWLKVDSQNLERYAVTWKDGVYTIEVRTDSGLLTFTDCSLEIENGEMIALLTAKNNKFDYLYLGSAADANADSENWIPAVLDADGRYTYEVPVESLDNTIAIATYSSQKRMWYDREMTFDSKTLIESE